MRTIKFRGKRLTDGAWIYGDFFRNRGLSFIASDGIEENPLATWRDYNVDPESVGQYTGLKDKNSKEIYDGDICRTKEGYFIVKWHNKACAFMAYNLKSYAPFSWFSNVETTGIEVVGNVHDNPELLKEK